MPEGPYTRKCPLTRLPRTPGATQGSLSSPSARRMKKVCCAHDALVVTIQIANYLTKRVLIYNGSLADILFWEAFIRMGITPDSLSPAQAPLKGFIGDVIQPIGAITLCILTETAPRTATTTVNFLVIKAPPPTT